MNDITVFKNVVRFVKGIRSTTRLCKLEMDDLQNDIAKYSRKPILTYEFRNELQIVTGNPHNDNNVLGHFSQVVIKENSGIFRRV